MLGCESLSEWRIVVCKDIQSIITFEEGLHTYDGCIQCPKKVKETGTRDSNVSSDPREGLSRSAAGLSTVASGADLPMNAGAIREAMIQAFVDPEFRKLLFQGPGTATPGSFVVPAVASETVAVTQPVVESLESDVPPLAPSASVGAYLTGQVAVTYGEYVQF